MNYTRSLWLIDMMEPVNRLEIQNVPENFSVDPQTKLLAISSPGRNNPFYHYTGAEDTLEFELTFYSTEDSRVDVIKKVKWLESMAKNDGYKGKIRHIGLDWHSTMGNFTGPPQGQLFEFSIWLVKSAPYTLSMFHGSRNMLPTLAKQKVTLVRTTSINQPRANIADFRY